MVFAALIYNPEITVCFSDLIWQNAVDLVQFQGSRVSGVVDTDCESVVFT